MVPLLNEAKHQVRCTEWPESLLAMLWAGALRGKAHEYACKISQETIGSGHESSREEGQVSP